MTDKISFWAGYYMQTLANARGLEKKKKYTFAFQICESYGIFKHDETIQEIEERTVGSKFYTLMMLSNANFWDESVRYYLVFFLAELFTFIKANEPEYKLYFMFTSQEWVSMAGFFAQAVGYGNGCDGDSEEKILKEFLKLVAKDRNS